MLNAAGKVVVNDWDHAGIIREGNVVVGTFRTVSLLCTPRVTSVLMLRLGDMAIYVYRFATKPSQDS